MRLAVACVGRPRDRACIALHDRYAERIRQLGVPYEASFVAEVKADGRYSPAHVREREAAALAARLDGRGTTVALDPEGVLLATPELARRLPLWASRCATFVIGGPLGLAPALREGATACWSLTPLTLPHELARVVLAEQLYRALTLLKGLPYHK